MGAVEGNTAKAVCRTCGGKPFGTCTCGAVVCAWHSTRYVDDSNRAISENAPLKCLVCMPPKYLRPFTLARALERGNGDWSLA